MQTSAPTPVRAREAALYDELWAALEAYGQHAPGEHYLPLFLQTVGNARGSVLDAGCGSGKGGAALARAGFDVWLCDLTDTGLDASARALPFTPACLWHDLYLLGRKANFLRNKFDYVYCCDVLEHIPPQFTMLVIDQLLRVTRKGLFLAVSLVPDSFGVWVGKPLHQTVQPFVWWRDNLRELGDVLEARDLHSNAVFFVRPR